jgi:outer membrane immunogenic protein
LKQSSVVFALLAAAALLTAPARADENRPFNGLYFGVHGGYAWQEVGGFFDHLDNLTNLSGNIDSPIFGAQLGYNLQYNWWVMGIEADASSLSDSGSRNTDLATGDVLTTDNRYLATIRGRVGFTVADCVWLYGTAGVAFTEYKFEEFPSAPFATQTLRLKENGAVYGGGAEWTVAYGVTLRAEYLHYDLSSASFIPGSFPNADGGDVTSFNDINVARAGVNINLSP